MTLRKSLVSMVLSAGLLALPSAHAAQHEVLGMKLEIPDSWEVKTQFMGLALLARPSQSEDAQGWAQDHIAVSQQAFRRAQTSKSVRVIESMTQEKIAQIGHHATDFKVLEQSDLKTSQGPARRIDMQYTEGLRSIRLRCILIPKGNSAYVSIVLNSSPHRFDSSLAVFDKAVSSLTAVRQ